MRGVGAKRLPVQPGGEHPLALADRLVRWHPVEAGGAPRRLVALHDEGRGLLVEAVGVRLVDRVATLHEGEGERVEEAPRAEPGEAGVPHVEVRLEAIRVLRADPAVHSVRRDDKIDVHEAVFGERAIVVQVHAEAYLGAQLLRPVLKHAEQLRPRDPAETVAAGGDGAATDVHVDVVPVGEPLGDRAIARLVGRTQVAQGLIGEDHAPAVGGIRRVSFQHDHPVPGIGALHQEGEIEAGRASADHGDLHARASSFRAGGGGRTFGRECNARRRTGEGRGCGARVRGDLGGFSRTASARGSGSAAPGPPGAGDPAADRPPGSHRRPTRLPTRAGRRPSVPPPP